MSKKRIIELKKAFKLKPHPEGGFYSEQYRSNKMLTSPNNGQIRSALTHIYFLLTKGDLSRWHKVIHDEIWHVYEGAPLRILSFNGTNAHSKIQDTQIGCSNGNIPTDYFKVIKGSDYQAAESTGDYTFCGCNVAPGFDFEDFSYIEDEKTKHWLSQQGSDFQKFL